MKTIRRIIMASLAILLLLRGPAAAQFALESPSQGEELYSAPDFSWTPGTYDFYLFTSAFHYDLGTVTGYGPVKFWSADNGFTMPASWWNLITEDNPCYWAVIGYNTSTQDLGATDIWTFTKKGCGSPSGTVYEVGSVDQMYSALQSAGPGDTVKLAPGTYYPPVKTWTKLPDYSNIYANLVVENGVTLAGSGSDETTIYANGTGAGIFFHGVAGLRDITVRGGDGWLLFAGGITKLTLCGVDIEGEASAVSYGDILYFQPWEGGNADLLVLNSTFRCSGCTAVSGILLDTCYSTGTNVINAEIHSTSITGLTEGIYYDNGEAACNDSTTIVTADCETIYGNTHNVYECTGGVDCVEHCP